MSNQYLLRLRKARFNFDKEEYTKVINTRIGSEGGGTILNHFFGNSSRITAFTMDETPQSVRGDAGPVDDKESRWSETVENTDSPSVGGRVRLYSESQVHTVSRWEDAELQDGISAEESGGASDGAPFRGRSQSAPAALWKAKKYGRQLRRMSDEFDTWLDRGDIRRVSSPGKVSQKQSNRGWFSFLWGSREEEEEGRE
ncbi:uncharacterized protein bada [Ictalurus punctatus]|uniref:Uncharacterized protein bada n=1 Tax=Ictalurus punctatus TaxID=7998 RepID=A0A2D0SYM2_ICTPU|nr:uncharacterized protein bada [Ictalurus punctatus]